MRNSSSGQVSVEFVLIMILLVSIALFVRRTVFLEGEFIANLVSRPWEKVAGLIESGKFGDPKKASAYHPGHGLRHLSLEGVSE